MMSWIVKGDIPQGCDGETGKRRGCQGARRPAEEWSWAELRLSVVITDSKP